MHSRYVLITSFVFCALQSMAQPNRQVYGRLTDTSRAPLYGIPVKLSVPGSKDTVIAFSQGDGSFSFTRAVPSRFNLTVDVMGYRRYNQNYHIKTAELILRLEAIELTTIIKTLQEVVISIPPVIIREDTVEYRADAFSVSENAIVEDLLKKLPGIQVSKNGVITAQGKPLTKVKVNGKDFFGGDIQTATRELPAGIIDKVQVIDDYGDEAAASGIKTGTPNKIINLTLKKEKEQGLFGKVSAGPGTEKTYQASVSANSFRGGSQLSVVGNSNNINNGYKQTGSRGGLPGVMSTAGRAASGGSGGIQPAGTGMPEGTTTSHSVGVNYRFDFGKNNSFYGSYTAGQRSTAGDRKIYQQYFYPTGRFTNEQIYQYNNGGKNHLAYLNLDWYPDSLTYLKISPRIFFNSTVTRNSTDFHYFREDSSMVSEGYFSEHGKGNTPDVGLNVLFNRRFRKRGRNLSASLIHAASWNNLGSDRPAFLRTYETGGNFLENLQLRFIEQNSRYHGYNLNIAYTEPISNNRFVDLTFFHGFSKSANTRKTYLDIPGSPVDSLLTELSNVFSNRFMSDRVGVQLRTVRKNYHYIFGLGVLPVNFKNYVNDKELPYQPKQALSIAPQFKFSGTLSRSKQIVITYNGNNRQPLLQELQPVRDISDIQNQREGNPDLKPEFIHSFNLSYSGFNFQGSTFFAGLGINSVQHKIVNNIVLLDSASGAQLSRPENTDGFYGFSGFYNYSKPWKENKFLLALNGSIHFNNNIVLVENNKNNAGDWYIVQDLSFRYTGLKGLEIGTGVNYFYSLNNNWRNRQNRLFTTVWTLSTDARIEIPGQMVLVYDAEYVINRGLSESYSKNIFLLNVSIERKILKQNGLYAVFSGYNLLNQGASFNRQVIGNSILDIQARQLSRYFLFSLTYRWNKFNGKSNR